jgi:LysR family hydrogen peroxide-inducible transcriptional activator
MAVSLKKDEQNSHVRPFKTPVPTREISLIYRRDHWKLAMIRAIEDTIAQNLPKAISQFPDKTHQVLEVC